MTRYDETFARHRREDDRQLENDVAEVMRSEAGRRLFMAILGKSGVYRSSRAESLEYDAGRRDAGLEVLNIVNRHALAQAEAAQKERNAMMLRRNAELEAAKLADEKERKR